MLSYNLFPVFSADQYLAYRGFGCSKAVLIFVCTYMPYQEVRLFFLFNVKLWYVGVAVVLIDLIQIPISNAGGHLAHLGGAFLGYIYARNLTNGRDIGSGFERTVSAVVNLLNASRILR